MSKDDVKFGTLSSNTIAEKKILLGKVTSVHGLLGWNKVYSWTQPAKNIFTHRKWLLKLSDRYQEVTIEEKRHTDRALFVRFKHCTSRNQAENYVNSDILVEEKLLPKLDKNEYYWHQLEGITVYLVDEKQSNINIGIIDHMMSTGANDVMVVKPTSQSIDKRERLLPWINDVILDVNLENGYIKISWDPEF